MSEDNAELVITLHEEAGDVYVSVEGELDIYTAGRFRREMNGAVEGAKRVELDLAGVSYCDSVGLRELLHLARLAQRRDVPLTVSGVHGNVQRILEISGMHDLFTRRHDT